MTKKGSKYNIKINKKDNYLENKNKQITSLHNLPDDILFLIFNHLKNKNDKYMFSICLDPHFIFLSQDELENAYEYEKEYEYKKECEHEKYLRELYDYDIDEYDIYDKYNDSSSIYDYEKNDLYNINQQNDYDDYYSNDY